MSTADPLVGRVIDGGWRLLEVKGTGTFSKVYRAARDDAPTDQYAIKILDPQKALISPTAVQEFSDEGDLLSGLSGCPNIVTLLEANVTATIPLVMPDGSEFPISTKYHRLELAVGVLEELVLAGTLDWETILEVLRQVTYGIHYMHRNGDAHRDLKSSNVLIAQGVRTKVLVSDLGRSCRLADPPRVPPDHYAFGRGDLRFAPPELLFGQGAPHPAAHRSADLYLIGSLLCEMSTGQSATSLLIANPHPLISRLAALPPDQRAQALRSEQQALIQASITIADLAAASAPKAIRADVRKLLTQLCHPIPSLRDQRHRRERNLPKNDLHWLLRRIDILRLQVRTNTRSTKTGL